MKNKLVCIVGMCGAGKSEVADFFVFKGCQYVRFGQITLDEVKRRGLAPVEANERPIREEFRKKHGPGAFAVLNMPKFDKLLKKSDVIGDGLYSWSEYKILKEKYGDRLIVVSVYASPKTRYERTANRADKHGEDKEKRFRSFSPEEAQSRDYAEIENIEKAGPIAMADYTIVNESTLEELKCRLAALCDEINCKE